MTPRKNARIQKLRTELAQCKTLHIRTAAEMLDVSEMTIRRDVRDHPNLFSFLGGHIIAPESGRTQSPYDLSQADDHNRDAKREAAANCLPYIAPNDTLFIDCGTTLTHLIPALPNDFPLTVICYAMNIADLVTRNKNIDLILLGGKYHPETASFHPVRDDPMLDHFAITTGIFTAAGLDPKLGASCTTFAEAAIKRAAIKRSQRRILVIDESKIGLIKPAHFAETSQFHQVLTENGIRNWD